MSTTEISETVAQAVENASGDSYAANGKPKVRGIDELQRLWNEAAERHNVPPDKLPPEVGTQILQDWEKDSKASPQEPTMDSVEWEGKEAPEEAAERIGHIVDKVVSIGEEKPHEDRLTEENKVQKQPIIEPEPTLVPGQVTAPELKPAEQPVEPSPVFETDQVSSDSTFKVPRGGGKPEAGWIILENKKVPGMIVLQSSDGQVTRAATPEELKSWGNELPPEFWHEEAKEERTQDDEVSGAREEISSPEVGKGSVEAGLYHALVEARQALKGEADEYGQAYLKLVDHIDTFADDKGMSSQGRADLAKGIFDKLNNPSAIAVGNMVRIYSWASGRYEHGRVVEVGSKSNENYAKVVKLNGDSEQSLTFLTDELEYWQSNLSKEEKPPKTQSAVRERLAKHFNYARSKLVKHKAISSQVVSKINQGFKMGSEKTAVFNNHRKRIIGQTIGAAAIMKEMLLPPEDNTGRFRLEGLKETQPWGKPENEAP